MHDLTLKEHFLLSRFSCFSRCSDYRIILTNKWGQAPRSNSPDTSKQIFNYAKHE